MRKIILKGWFAMSLPANYFKQSPYAEATSEPLTFLPDDDERSKSLEHKDRFDFGGKNQNLKKNEEN